MSVIVHIAGEIVAGVQRCSRCGAVLVDYRGAQIAVASGEKPVLSGWAESSFVGRDGNQSFLMNCDATAFDESPCNAKVQ